MFRERHASSCYGLDVSVWRNPSSAMRHHACSWWIRIALLLGMQESGKMFRRRPKLASNPSLGKPCRSKNRTAILHSHKAAGRTVPLRPFERRHLPESSVTVIFGAIPRNQAPAIKGTVPKERSLPSKPCFFPIFLRGGRSGPCYPRSAATVSPTTRP